GYMPPEQALDMKSADARADIYSLGCTLYYLLTAELLYAGKTLMATLLAHRDQPVPSLRKARSDVTVELDAVFQKMDAKSPADRYQTAVPLLEALERCDLRGAARDVSIADAVADESPPSNPAVAAGPGDFLTSSGGPRLNRRRLKVAGAAAL